MLWDNDYLYVIAEMESRMCGHFKTKGQPLFFITMIWKSFMTLDGDTHNYYEYEMNAHNTCGTCLLTKPYRESW